MENNELNQNNEEKTVNPVEEYVKEIQAKQDKLHGKVKEDIRPDFLLPQFKNIEEQAKSYKELQALQTKQAQELAKYRKTSDLNAQKNLMQQQLALLEQKSIMDKQTLNDIYAREIENLHLAVSSGKISKQEAQICLGKLENFILSGMQNASNNYKTACSQCGQQLNMLSPKEFFEEDVKTRNYLAPVSDFLESNYRQMPKSELESVKNLITSLENSLRDEILNENKLAQDNASYRQNLASTTNLNPNNISEKIYTMSEIKNMKPEDFRKNQKAILEQFVANKIK